MLNGVQEQMPLSPIGATQAKNDLQNLVSFSLLETDNMPFKNDQEHPQEL